MTRGELLRNFRELLNRNDLTDELADLFISDGIRRVERVLRTQFQRKVIQSTIPADFVGYIDIPSDYIGIYWIKVNGIRLSREADAQDEIDYLPGQTRSFYMEGDRFYFVPSLKQDDIVRIEYYATINNGFGDDDTTQASAIIPDLVRYAALIFAAIYYVDERLPTYQSIFRELRDEVQLQNDLDAFAGGVAIRNPYEGIA